jgi:protein-disulfide isomerase
MNKNIIAIIGAVVAVFAFLSLAYTLTNKPEENSKAYPQVNQIKPTDHVKWAKNGKNLLVVYSDFYCPACKMFSDLLDRFEATGSSELAITENTAYVFRHYPIHEASYTAAYAAEAAGKQGKFYEMSRLIYADQEKLSQMTNTKEALLKMAESLDLDIARFEKDFSSDEVKKKVAGDQKSGDEVLLEATPTFFLNGRKLEFNTIDEFVQMLKEG